jgi:translation elongation factor P/translation initiation factor 5A
MYILHAYTNKGGKVYIKNPFSFSEVAIKRRCEALKKAGKIVEIVHSNGGRSTVIYKSDICCNFEDKTCYEHSQLKSKKITGSTSTR